MTNRRKKPRGTTTQSGYWAAKRALTRFGCHALDGRTRIAKSVDELRASLVNDLGGPSALSRQREMLLNLTLRTHLLLESLDAFIFSMPSPVNKRKRSVWPLIQQRQALADGLARYLSLLGLERLAKPAPTLQQFIVAFEREKADEKEKAECQAAEPEETGTAEAQETAS